MSGGQIGSVEVSGSPLRISAGCHRPCRCGPQIFRVFRQQECQGKKGNSVGYVALPQLLVIRAWLFVLGYRPCRETIGPASGTTPQFRVRGVDGSLDGFDLAWIEKKTRPAALRAQPGVVHREQ